MLTGLINIELRSTLPVERLQQINHLAVQAHVNSGLSPKTDSMYLDSLVVETCALKDVYEGLSETGIFNNFYENIDKAFRLLIEKTPHKAGEVFETYSQLNSLFRVIDKEKSIINQKWQETSKLLDDINIIDEEDVSRRKGGFDHGR